MEQDWSTFIQGVAGNLAGAAIDAKYRAPIDLQKLKLQAYGPYGEPYIEGVATPAQTGFAGIPPLYLLLGAGLFAVLLLKD